MSIPQLTIVPAGAGSGKTHRIQETLADWVINRGMPPDKIVAVTFTEAAAAELRGRIRGALLGKGRLEDALRLDQAYISTIHGFGLRLLTSFALDGGLSPFPRLLNEDEEAILLRLALSGTGQGDEIAGNLKAFGYVYNHNTGKGAEDLFRDAILGLISRLRAIGCQEEDPRHLEHVRQLIDRLYGPPEDPAVLKGALLDAVGALLTQSPDDLSPLFPGNDTAQKALRTNYLEMKRVTADPSVLDRDWPLWQRLRDLRLSKRGSALPEGYDDLAEGVMAAASGLVHHPGPLAEAHRHVEALLGVSQDCLSHYATVKREKGLIDYADMLALAFELLRGNPTVMAELRSRVACLVIDEFQDTNPLQFSLLWTLYEAGIPTLVVGDLKQAIMGFQGADPRLLEELQRQFPDATDPLTGNWRSQAKLMDWINALGPRLFGTGYTELAPKAPFTSKQSPLEAIEFQKKANKDIRAQHTAARLRALLDDPSQEIYDRHTKVHRRLRGGDIAILCPTNKHLTTYAAALRAFGLRSRIEQEGWFESRPVQLAFHALSLVADPGDRHAALYLAATELGDETLSSALLRLLDGQELEGEPIDRLRRIAENVSDQTVDTVVAETIAALDLYGVVAKWPDAAQARANLLRLQGEAGEFLAANREALAAGGYYGSGLKTFLAWLRDRAKAKNGQPDAQIRDEDAAQLMTWHKSKGREWPVVAVCCSDYTPPLYFPHIGLDYPDFGDFWGILDQARISVCTKFAAPEVQETFCEPLLEEIAETGRRLLYVALTRAREKVILEWPTYLKPEGNTYWHIFQQSTGVALAGNRMRVGEKEFDCRVVQCGKEPPEDMAQKRAVQAMTLPVLGRRAIEPRPLPAELTPETRTPSLRKDVELSSAIPVQQTYGTRLEVDLPLAPAERGTVLHRCFEVMGKGRSLETVRRATGHPFTDEQFAALESAVSGFHRWLQEAFSPIAVEQEIPILALDEQGSVVSGVIDLLVETTEGFWILDHKSDRVEDFEKGFGHYLGQLSCYAEAIRRIRLGKPVLGLGINWLGYGTISFMAGEMTKQKTA